MRKEHLILNIIIFILMFIGVMIRTELIYVFSFYIGYLMGKIF